MCYRSSAFLSSGCSLGHAIYFPELFPTEDRSTGVAFCNGAARVITSRTADRGLARGRARRLQRRRGDHGLLCAAERHRDADGARDQGQRATPLTSRDVCSTAFSAPIAVRSRYRYRTAAPHDLSFTGAPTSMVNGDRVTTVCSISNPASANSAVNSANARSRPPVMTSIVMSTSMSWGRFGSVIRPMTISRPVSAYRQPQARRIVPTFASAWSNNTRVNKYASPAWGLEPNISPPTASHRSATLRALQDRLRPSDDLG